MNNHLFIYYYIRLKLIDNINLEEAYSNYIKKIKVSQMSTF